MIILPFLHFFCLLFFFYLAVFVIYKDSKAILNRVFSVIMVCFALWNFGDIFIHNTNTAISRSTVVILQNISTLGWATFASAVLYFALAFAKREKILKNKWFLIIILIIPLFFVYLQWTNCLMINPVRRPYGWSFTFANTIWTYLFYIYYSLFTILSVYIVYSYGRMTKILLEKKQAKIITFSIISCLIIGTMFDVGIPVYSFNSIPSIGNLIVILFSAGICYAIVKYRFLRITPALAAENIISAMNDFLILLNPDGDILTVNKSTLNSLQYENNELVGKSISMLFQDDDFKQTILGSLANEEDIKNQDGIFLSKSGNIVPIIFSCSTLKNEDGIIIGTVVIARDITERKQVEISLSRSEEKFRLISENTNDTIIVFDLDLNITYISPAIEKILGYTQDEAQLLTIDQILTLESLQKVYDIFKQVLPNELSGTVKNINYPAIELEELHKNGSRVWAELSFSFLKNDANKPIGIVTVSRDITDRKLTEQALQVSEEKFRLAFKTSPESININRLCDGLYIDVNEGFTAVMGYSAEDVVGKTSLAIDIWENPEDRNRLVAGLMFDGRVDNLEANFRLKDGSIINGLMSAAVITLNDEPHIISITRDVTEKKLIEKALRDSEIRYRAIVRMFRLMADNMPDMLWAKDLNKDFVFANKATVENLLNASDTDEPIGKSHLFFAERERQQHLDRDDWHTFGELCQDSDQVVMDSGKTEDFDEFGNVHGKFLFLDVRKAPIFDENGVMIGVVGSARDVTQQKKVESEIYKKDKLLDAIAKAVAVLVQGENLEEDICNVLEIIGKATDANRVYVFRNHDDSKYTMPMMSQSYEWTDGLVEPQINNPDLQNVPYEIACPRWYDTLSKRKVIVGNVSEFPEPEKTTLTAQGIKSLLVTPVFINDFFWGFIGFDDCLKEREWLATEEQILAASANTIGTVYLRYKNQEELVTAKEKAEESDRLKSAFLTNMSHEIRTPMNGILGFANLLKERNLPDEEHDNYIHIIEQSGARMLNIINDIIDISKIEAGQVEINLSEININEKIEYIYNSFLPEAGEKGLRLFSKTVLEWNDAVIKTDAVKVYAVLTNLVKNAIKFTYNGTIEFGYNIIKNNGITEIQYFVTDTGIGISKEQQKIIFDRFRQGSESLSRNYEGAGLGLAISKAYVEILGGKMWVDSVEGIGSKFYFTIPYLTDIKENNIKYKNIDIHGEESD